MKKQSVVLGLLLINSLIPCFAQETAPAPSGEKYTIRRVFKEGDTERFKATATVSGEMMVGEGMNMPVDTSSTMVYVFKTTGIKDGIATVVTTVEKMTVVANGTEMNAEDMGMDLKSMKTTQKMNDRCEIVGSSTPAGGAANPMMQMMGGGSNPNSFLVVFPEGPVSVGESWEVEMPNPMKEMMGDAVGDVPAMRTRYTLEGIEKVGGKEAFKIKQEMNMAMALDGETLKKIGSAQGQPMPFNSMDMQTKGTITHFVEKATGRTLKADGQIEGKVLMKMDASQTENAPPGLSGDLNVNTSTKLTVASLPSLTPKAPAKAPAPKPKPAPKKPAGKGK